MRYHQAIGFRRRQEMQARQKRWEKAITLYLGLIFMAAVVFTGQIVTDAFIQVPPVELYSNLEPITSPETDTLDLEAEAAVCGDALCITVPDKWIFYRESDPMMFLASR